jgi:K+-transporting ATPase ATPase C chain
MKNLIIELRISLVATFALAIILCGFYPFFVWVLAQGLFPEKANGSLVVHNGNVAGASLIGQGFADPKYFYPRPSAAGQGYDATSSGGSNLGPTSKKLADALKERILIYRTQNGLSPRSKVPADAVTSSGSGLDPHISVQNALFQAGRVAKARSLSEETVRKRIKAHTEGRMFGVLGEPRVNVLMLNLDMDGRL